MRAKTRSPAVLKALMSGERSSSDIARCPNVLNNQSRIELEYFRQFDQFNDINPALAALQACNEGLVLTEPSRKVRLRHPGPFPGCNK